MPVTQTMVFTATPPTTGETPTTFNANAIACWNDLKNNIVPDMNTAFTQMNALETNVNAKEASAVVASAAAVAVANFQGTWTNQLTSIPQSWEYNGILYMVLVAGTDSPTTTPSNWFAIGTASNTVYDNTTSGLSATTVQDMGDELASEKANLASPALTGTPTAPTAPTGTNTTQIATTAFVIANSGISQDFRLTLTTGVPVTISGVTAATSIYLTPYIGNKLSIYDGSAWITYATAELSIAVPATTNTMYDIFVYSNSGTPTLELTAWTNDTTRATALVKQDGVYVKTGTTTRRYLGSFRTTGVSGQTEDSLTKRYLWNYYNRVTRPMYVTDVTASWAYSTGTWRQANGNTANQIDFVIGVSEDVVRALATHSVSNSGTTGSMQTGIGLDTTSTPSNLLSTNGSTAGTTMLGTPIAEYMSPISAGRHFLAWLELPTAVGTSTWRTDATKVGLQGEIIG